MRRRRAWDDVCVVVLFACVAAAAVCVRCVGAEACQSSVSVDAQVQYDDLAWRGGGGTYLRRLSPTINIFAIG